MAKKRNIQPHELQNAVMIVPHLTSLTSGSVWDDVYRIGTVKRVHDLFVGSLPKRRSARFNHISRIPSKPPHVVEGVKQGRDLSLAQINTDLLKYPEPKGV